jgi:multiple sugar transport system substrate-binding protein
MFRSATRRIVGLTAVAALAVGACSSSGGTPAPAASSGASMVPTTQPIVTKGPAIVNGKHVVRWFVGLGSGTNPQQIALQQQVVNDFNALQDKKTSGDKILLSLEIVQNNTATDILKTEIASNNAPDIVGPVGIKGRVGFNNSWADITPLAKAANFDLTQIDPNILKNMSDASGKLLGMPYAVYPSFIFYNKDLFDEAGLSYPPQKVGDQYKMPDGTMVDWNWDTVRKIGMLLSVDKNGKDATQSGFDPANQTQFGFEFQWTEGRRMASTFGSGSLVAADGKTAQFPDNWKAAWKYYYNAIWTDHFIANDTERNSDLLAKGNVLSSGHAAMGHMFMWYDCCMSADPTKPNGAFKKFDIAVMPSYNGTTTAPINMDTFSITKQSSVQQDAFEAVQYLMSRGDLSALYGGIPLVGDQLAFLHKYVDALLAPQFPGNTVNWQVAIDMEKYAEAVNHEAEFPDYIQGMDDYGKVFSSLSTTQGLDLDKAFTDLVAKLQTDFNTNPANG